MDIALAAPPTETAPSLLLRRWADEDVPAILAAHRDPLMRRFLRRRYTTAEQVRQAVAAARLPARRAPSCAAAVRAPARRMTPRADDSPGG